jgi:hypothetical protein
VRISVSVSVLWSVSVSVRGDGDGDGNGKEVQCSAVPFSCVVDKPGPYLDYELNSHA